MQMKLDKMGRGSMANSEIILNSQKAEDGRRSQQADYEALSKELAEKELELATLENELAAFEDQYARTIGVLFAELDEIEREIARELWHLHPEEKYHRNFQDAERKARASQDAIKDKLAQAKKKVFKPSDELRNLFRRVAKAIHPDLAASEDEIAYRTILMSRANIAYNNGDIEALKQILVDWENRDRLSINDDVHLDTQDYLERKILRIKARIKEIETRIAALKESELYKLMLAVEQADQQGRDLLKEMADSLHLQIQQAKRRLDSLRQQRK
jgi:hypothetical protein